jgi:glycosyltransferase involved in cell wall biosynthesis
MGTLDFLLIWTEAIMQKIDQMYPKVTVLLPVFNAGAPLEVAIKSILIQDFTDFEFLIIDDASTDASAEIIREYAKIESRIRAIYHSSNQGLAKTLNEGLQEARADFIARMDQDDEALPHRLRTQYLFIKSRPKIVVVGSYFFLMGRNRSRDRLVKVPTSSSEIAKTLQYQNCLCHPSVMLRCKEVLGLGGYRSEFKNAEDYDLWLRVSKNYEIANIPIPLIRYRFSVTGMTLSRKWEQLYYVFLALAANKDQAFSYALHEQEAKKSLEDTNKSEFLESVLIETAENLIRLGFFRKTVRLFWLFSKDVGWWRALTIGWKLFQRRGFMRKDEDENWPLSGMHDVFEK